MFVSACVWLRLCARAYAHTCVLGGLYACIRVFVRACICVDEHIQVPGQAEPGCMCVRVCVCLTGILRCGKLRPEEIVVVGTATT